MKVLIACVGKMIFVMPVMWFWVLVVCAALVEPERISDVSGLISPDVIGWAAGAISPSLSFPYLHAQRCTDTQLFQHICSKSKTSNAGTPERSLGHCSFTETKWNDIERTMKVTNRLQLLALGLCIAGTAIAAPDVAQ